MHQQRQHLMKRDKKRKRVHFSERLMSSAQHGNDNFAMLLKPPWPTQIGRTLIPGDRKHLHRETLERHIAFLCWSHPRNNNSNNKKIATSSPFLSVCAAKQDDSSSGLLYAFAMETACAGTRHKGCSCALCVLLMTSWGILRSNIDLKPP